MDEACEETEQEITIIIDQTPPTATISAPVDGQEVWPEFTVSLSAVDNIGLDHYELYINGQKYAEYTASPTEQVLKLEPGEYMLKARAVDQAEYESWTESVKIIVINPDTTPPVFFTQPDDIRYEDGTTGHVLNWTVGDRYPNTFQANFPNIMWIIGDWTNGTLTLNIDGLAPRDYHVFVSFYDKYGNMVQDVVHVTVTGPPGSEAQCGKCHLRQP